MPKLNSAYSPLKVVPAYWLFVSIILAASGYWISFASRSGALAVLPAQCGVFLLARARTSRQAFYFGLAAGLAMYGPPLAFFATIFGKASIALYLIAALPVAIFVLILHAARRRFSEPLLIILTPLLWTGIEYFRSELYALRFAWLLPGQAVAFGPGVRLLCVGVYGLSFVLALTAALLISRRNACRVCSLVAALVLTILMYWPMQPTFADHSSLHVAGVQLEFPTAEMAAGSLDRLAIAHPEAQILVLSEYSFNGPVPEVVRNVLRKHHRYLVAGGTRPLSNGNYYDTAFVIGPDGSDLFEQAKSVPVQFMSDGLPAPTRKVWNSPWGKIGIAICYDLSYARVMDDFVRQGAAGLIIPTEDGEHWGEFERRMLHGRMAPVRSAEYGIPTFGVWSSGVSQLTDKAGRVISTAGYPGQGEMIGGPFDLSVPGHVPPDRWFSLLASMMTACLAIYFIGVELLNRHARSKARGIYSLA